MSVEIWLTAPQAPLYEISNFGCVRRGTFLLKTPLRNGYPKVSLYADGVMRQVSVHRLVAALFLTPVAGCDQINHKDGDKTNNRASNLEWASPKQNIAHAIRNGLRKTKLSEAQARAIKAEKLAGGDPGEIAQRYGVSKPTVHNIAAGRKWPELQLELL